MGFFFFLLESIHVQSALVKYIPFSATQMDHFNDVAVNLCTKSTFVVLFSKLGASTSRQRRSPPANESFVMLYVGEAKDS